MFLHSNIEVDIGQCKEYKCRIPAPTRRCPRYRLSLTSIIPISKPLSSITTFFTKMKFCHAALFACLSSVLAAPTVPNNPATNEKATVATTAENLDIPKILEGIFGSGGAASKNGTKAADATKGGSAGGLLGHLGIDLPDILKEIGELQKSGALQALQAGPGALPGGATTAVNGVLGATGGPQPPPM